MKKTVQKVLHPRRTHRASLDNGTEDNDGYDCEAKNGSLRRASMQSSRSAESQDLSAGSTVSSSESRTTFSSSIPASNGLAQGIVKPISVTGSRSSSDASEIFVEAPEPNQAIGNGVHMVHNTGGSESFAKHPQNLMKGGPAAPNEEVPFQLSPIDRHYLNKALVQ